MAEVVFMSEARDQAAGLPRGVQVRLYKIDRALRVAEAERAAEGKPTSKPKPSRPATPAARPRRRSAKGR